MTLVAFVMWIMLPPGWDTSSVPEEFAQQIFVYRIDQAGEAAVASATNVNTRDARGELARYLLEFLLPLECSGSGRDAPHCGPSQRPGPNRTVTELELVVDSRTTNCSQCGACNDTGTPPGPCASGARYCDWRASGADRRMVGKCGILDEPAPICREAFGSRCARAGSNWNSCASCVRKLVAKPDSGCASRDVHSLCRGSACSGGSPDWACWAAAVPRRTGGSRYSTLSRGRCGASRLGPCSWHLLRAATVGEPCLRERLVTAVERTNPVCFGGCGRRDVSSACWTRCFFTTVLGEGARSNGSDFSDAMSLEALERGWTHAFRSLSMGGCPRLGPDAPPPSSATGLLA